MASHSGTMYIRTVHTAIHTYIHLICLYKDIVKQMKHAECRKQDNKAYVAYSLHATQSVSD